METVMIRNPNSGRFAKVEVPLEVQEPAQEVTPGTKVALVLIAYIAILLAVTNPVITIPLGITIGAVYGVKSIISTIRPGEVTEAVTEPPVKRHWQRRLKVHSWEHPGKTIRI